MQLTRALALALTLALVVIPAVAFAGDAPVDAPVAANNGRRERLAKLSPEERAQLRDRVQDKIKAYLAKELAAKAGLDEKKKGQLATAIDAQLEKRAASHEARKQAHQRLRQLVEQKAPDSQLKPAMEAMIAAREDRAEALLAETSRFLTPLEQAKVMLAFPDVMKEAKHLMKEARSKRGKGRGGFGGDDATP